MVSGSMPTLALASERSKNSNMYRSMWQRWPMKDQEKTWWMAVRLPQEMCHWSSRCRKDNQEQTLQVGRVDDGSVE